MLEMLRAGGASAASASARVPERRRPARRAGCSCGAFFYPSGTLQHFNRASVSLTGTLGPIHSISTASSQGACSRARPAGAGEASGLLCPALAHKTQCSRQACRGEGYRTKQESCEQEVYNHAKLDLI